MFAQLALRNIAKHGKRSAVVVSAVAVAVLVLTGIGGVIRGLSDTVLSSIVPTSGHLVITAEGARDAANPLDLRYLIADAEAVVASVNDPRVEVAETVLTFGALLVQPVEPGTDAEAKNLALMGQGVAPDTRFLASIRQGITDGAFLPEGRGLALSNRAARLLGVGPGGSVMVLTTDRGGNPWYQEVPITGLFNSGSEQTDLSVFVVSRQTAQDLVDGPGMAREIRILLDDRDQAEAVAAALAPTLAASGLRIEPWQVTFASVLTVLKFLDIIFFLIRTFFVIVAGSVITNSLLMTIFERIREYGTLRAIGLKTRQLRAMILTEGAVLGLGGSVLGLVLGIPLVLTLSAIGIDLGNATEALGFASLIYPQFAPIDGVFNLVFGVLIAVAASFYASRVAGRLSVNEALTHV